MQENLLRVCLLALSLFLCPRDKPGLEELHDITATDRQKHAGSLLEEVDKLGGERTQPDVTSPPSDKSADTQEQNPSPETNAARGDKIRAGNEDAKDSSHEESVGKYLNPSGSQNFDSELKDVEDKQNTADLPRDVTLEGWNQRQGQHKPLEEESEAGSSGKLDSSCSYLHTRTPEREEQEDPQQDYTWYIWNTFSIISMIRLLRKCLGRLASPRRPLPLTCTAAEAPLPSSDTLQLLHSTCIQPQVEKKVWEGAFLEGFANDLVDAMRLLRDMRGSAVIEGYRMVDSHDIVVPFRPSELHSFQCQLQGCQAGEWADAHVCAQIKVVQAPEVQSDCPCQSSGADDTVCLLHCETPKPKLKADIWGDLCAKNSPLLSKYKVTRLFQNSVKEAWERISHKYEFELSVGSLDSPGTHVRFRSGKKISFTLTPVVKYNADCYFFVGPFAPHNPDTLWPLSLANYEDHFLKEIAKGLPQNSCHTQTLQIGLFLHRKQRVLTGTAALKDSHFKAALMHLILTKDPPEWRQDSVAQRLRDLLDFMEKSLERRSLPHALIANPAAQKVLQLPAELVEASAVNLFHPLVVHDCIYRSTTVHFQELLKNANMLINDYVAQSAGCASLRPDKIYNTCE